MSNEKSGSQVAEELVSVPNGLRPGAGETILIVSVSASADGTTHKPEEDTSDKEPIANSTTRKRVKTKLPTASPPTPGNISNHTKLIT